MKIKLINMLRIKDRKKRNRYRKEKNRYAKLIEVHEDLYTLMTDCMGKRMVGKANKGINVEKLIIGF